MARPPPPLTITANGITFEVDASGFGGHTIARDAAMRRLEQALREQSAQTLTRIEGGTLDEIAALAVRSETQGWACWQAGYTGTPPVLKLVRR